MVRAYRSVEGHTGRLAEREQAMARHATRELNYYYDDDDKLVIRSCLQAEAGAVVLQALNAVMDAQYTPKNDNTTSVDAADGVTAVTSVPEERFAQRCADALKMIAETTLRHGPEPLSSAERYQVVVHVTAETLATDAAGHAARAALPRPRLPLSRVHP
ncbi:DUF222 domain-containing protein [Gammaproteobacteria bacterium]|nr:DUF222 domain-containing protein [Gammaproteobacteria bacterium]